MIEMKEASSKAIDYLKDLIEETYHISLEETELSEDGKFWFVIMGYSKETAGYNREFREFKIDAESGKMVSMKRKKY